MPRQRTSEDVGTHPAAESEHGIFGDSLRGRGRADLPLSQQVLFAPGTSDLEQDVFLGISIPAREHDDALRQRQVCGSG